MLGRAFFFGLMFALGCGDDSPHKGEGGGGGGGAGVTTTTTATTTVASTATQGGHGGGTTASSGMGGSGGDGGGGGGDPFESCQVVAPPQGDHGTVFAAASPSGPESHLGVGFVPAGTPDTCVRHLCGTCRVTTCSYDSSSPPQPVAVNAGTISFTGGDLDVQAPVLSDGTYGPFAGAHFGSDAIFSGGEMITFDAAGGDVPAFSHTLLAPSEVLVSAPSFGSLVVPRDQDLLFEWTGESAGTLLVLAAASLPPDPGQPTLSTSRSFACEMPVADGVGVVPSSVLQVMPEGEGLLVVSTTTYESIQIDTWSIDVRLELLAAAVVSPTGGATESSVEFE